MTSKPTSRRTFTPVLSQSELMDPGQIFPREELTPRILSAFWRNCCSVPRFSRAPAPVVELSETADAAETPVRLRAWWILCDGIVEESEGPYSERLALFFGEGGRHGQLWPRYEFRVLEQAGEVAMNFHLNPGEAWGSRVRFEVLADGRLRITGQEPRWG